MFVFYNVRCNKFSAPQTEFIKAIVKKAVIKNKSITIKKGSSKIIRLKKKVKKASYSFKSRNKKVASVNKKGKITAKNDGKTFVIVYQKLNSKKVKIGKVTVKVKSNKADTVISPLIPE